MTANDVYWDNTGEKSDLFFDTESMKMLSTMEGLDVEEETTTEDSESGTGEMSWIISVRRILTRSTKKEKKSIGIPKKLRSREKRREEKERMKGMKK